MGFMWINDMRHTYSRFQVSCPITEKMNQTDLSNSAYSMMLRYSLHLIGYPPTCILQSHTPELLDVGLVSRMPNTSVLLLEEGTS